MRISGEKSGQKNTAIRIAIEGPDRLVYALMLEDPSREYMLGQRNMAYINFTSLWEMKDFIDLLDRVFRESIKRQGAWQAICPHCGGAVFERQEEEKE